MQAKSALDEKPHWPVRPHAVRDIQPAVRALPYQSTLPVTVLDLCSMRTWARMKLFL